MKIYDKRRDYFDYIVPDSTEPVWVRDAIIEKFDSPNILSKDDAKKMVKLRRSMPFPDFDILTPKSGTSYASVKCCVVGFCGKLYLVYRLVNVLGDLIFSSGNPENFTKKVKESYNTREGLSSYDVMFGHRPVFTNKGVDKWLDEHNRRDFSDIFLKIGSPVFLIDNREEMVINPILKSIGFQSIVDPWTAYQEIDRYLGNDLVKDQLADFKMSDELKRDSKGFDKWSFKNGPKKR